MVEGLKSHILTRLRKKTVDLWFLPSFVAQLPVFGPVQSISGGVIALYNNVFSITFFRKKEKDM
ncbi:hypothetical protein [Brenneria tiliae]|uniref:hypothetical protein n=1 Tax=Brenneria tiliae TaxID=2914984 RepID=UPI002014E0B6|nr:hypothetical protein [Brenneria tiliae]